MYIAKNHTDGPDNYVVGGTLTVESGATLEVKDGATVTGLTETAAAASESALGGIKAATKGAGDTVECKIDGDTDKLYVPTYPTDATTEAAGLVKVAANQAASTEETSPTVAEFNALLAALKAAGLMAADA